MNETTKTQGVATLEEESPEELEAWWRALSPKEEAEDDNRADLDREARGEL